MWLKAKDWTRWTQDLGTTGPGRAPRGVSKRVLIEYWAPLLRGCSPDAPMADANCEREISSSEGSTDARRSSKKTWSSKTGLYRTFEVVPDKMPDNVACQMRPNCLGEAATKVGWLPSCRSTAHNCLKLSTSWHCPHAGLGFRV